MKNADKFIDYLKASPSDFHAVEAVEKLLKKKNNFSDNNEKIVSGSSYVFKKTTKDGAALIAADIGENANTNAFPINLVVSHCDSPWFDVEGDELVNSEGVSLVKTKKYGGFSLQIWQDRPLTLAGRVCLTENGRETEKLIYLENETFIVPSMCYHFSRYVAECGPFDQGFPFMGESKTSSKGVKAYLAKKLSVSEENIVDYKLSFVCKQQPSIWGENNEFLSAARLDDLACAYTSTEAFISSHNPGAINILYIADNEEIGSNTEVGGLGSFLKETLSFIADKLGFDLSEALKGSFMLSADNAQGVHPHHQDVYNPNYKVYMNKGFAVKVSERYSTTERSLEIYKNFCKKNKVPCQVYYNREDIKGGGTVGKLVQKNVPIESADIGLPQLAMHSAYETMGTKDIDHAIKTFKAFYGKFLFKDFE